MSLLFPLPQIADPILGNLHVLNHSLHMDYAQINHTDCSLLWNLKMCLGTFPEYSRTMQPLPNHHWQYPAFSSFDSTPALQIYQFPYCFIAFYPSAISILAVLWNSFLTFLSLFFAFSLHWLSFQVILRSWAFPFGGSKASETVSHVSS